ncbi:hypothetical protein AC1031_014527, partial [Aphanomyces cochlioides]
MEVALREHKQLLLVLRRQWNPIWTPEDIKRLLRLVLEGAIYTKKGMWPEKKLDTTGDFWRKKYCALRDLAMDYIFKISKKRGTRHDWLSSKTDMTSTKPEYMHNNWLDLDS